MNIAIICSVRGAEQEYIDRLYKYVEGLEYLGNHVHFPHRDNDQEGRGIEICRQNAEGIAGADEVHVFYNPDSQGTHFDMGMAFVLGKKVLVMESIPLTEGKSFQRMLVEWEEEGGKAIYTK